MYLFSTFLQDLPNSLLCLVLSKYFIGATIKLSRGKCKIRKHRDVITGGIRGKRTESIVEELEGRCFEEVKCNVNTR